MPDTILNPALTALIPDKTKTNVFLGGTLALLEDDDTYPGDLQQIALTKVSIAIEVDRGETMGPNSALTYLQPIRRWTKTVKRTVKVETSELKNTTVLELFSSGPKHGKMKLQAKDPGDAADTASLLLGEFEGEISLDGSIEGTQGEISIVQMNIDIEGEVVLAVDQGMS